MGVEGWGMGSAGWDPGCEGSGEAGKLGCVVRVTLSLLAVKEGDADLGSSLAGRGRPLGHWDCTLLPMLVFQEEADEVKP